MTTSNIEQNGWIKSIDPTSNRTFYANRYTRTTQWDPPPEWIEPLPEGWEEMEDASSGRKFYIDHANKITTWDRPAVAAVSGSNKTTTGFGFSIDNNPAARNGNTASSSATNTNTNSNSNTMNSNTGNTSRAMNQYGNHSHWDTDPRKGTRANSMSSRNNRNSNYDNINSNLQSTSSHPGPPPLDFRTVSVPDSLRPHCPGPSCTNTNTNSKNNKPPIPFSLTRRRHHCRLCGDVFCDACTSHRTVLPLDGPEFDLPVRVCDMCMADVKGGNYFSWRRYLTPLQLYDHDDNTMKTAAAAAAVDDYLVPLDIDGASISSSLSGLSSLATKKKKKKKSETEGSSSSNNNNEPTTTALITLQTVNASLSSLSIDIRSLLQTLDDPSSISQKLSTVPAITLVEAVGRHLKCSRESGEYAIRVLGDLLMVGNLVGDDSFGMAIYEADYSSSLGALLSTTTATTTMGESMGDTARQQQPPPIRPPPLQSCELVNDILSILEWNGNDSRTLAALEQAAKIIYYITEPNFVANAMECLDAKRRSLGVVDDVGGGVDGVGGGVDGDGWNDVDTNNNSGPIDVDAMTPATTSSNTTFLPIDIHRAFRAMLDHATSSSSPSLQRWATSSLRHLIAEDQRRACCCVVYNGGSSKNDSSGDNDKYEYEYESFTKQLVSTGGVMILCSLLGAEDADIRAHATSALEAIVIATREIGMAVNKTSGTNGIYRAGRGTKGDAMIVDAIVSNGGCGPALAHLLISADESVAMMGCAFASSLISPLLTDPRGSGRTLQLCTSSAASGMGSDAKDDGLASYRHAALVLVVGDGSDDDASIRSDVSCLPALIQILRSGLEQSWGGHNTARSIKLQVMASECLAAISLAVGHIVSETANGRHNSTYESLSRKAYRALEVMEQERIYDVAFRLVSSASSRSLDASRDTPQARLREAAGLILLACSSCSSEAASYLISNRAVSELITIAGESGMLTASSALRGDWASRGLCFLEASTTLLIQAWKNTRKDNNTSSTSPLNLLLEALDAGAVGIASRVVKAKVELKNHDAAYSNIRVKIAICFMLSAMFGIARADEKQLVGTSRLYNAVDADCAASLAYDSNVSGRIDLVASTIALLRATAPYAQRFANGNTTNSKSADEPLPMLDLSEASLLAVGSMCGAVTGCFASGSIGSSSSDDDLHVVLKSTDFGEVEPDKYSHLRRDASHLACDILTMRTDQGPFLPSVLIGTIGESCVVPALRLALAIAQNGHDELRGEIVRSGIFVPLSDILQNALSAGDRYTFSVAIALVRFCGPCANVGSADAGSIASLKNAIRTISCVLAISEPTDDLNNKRMETLTSLKLESLITLEALSSNDSLHNSISSNALPALAELLNSGKEEMVCSALKTIQRIISLPSSAATVADNGIIASLVQLVSEKNSDSIQEIALELLLSVASAKHNISKLLTCGTLEATTSLLGETNPCARVTMLGLEVVGLILSILESSLLSPSARKVISQQAINALAGQDRFLKALTATMLKTANAWIVDGTLVSGSASDGNLSVPPLYGQPFHLPEVSIGGFNNPQDKAISILFKVASLLCGDEGGPGREEFLNAFMLKEVRGAERAVPIACSIFLDILNDEINGICVPQNPDGRRLFIEVELPTVRRYLLEGLSSSVDECLSSNASKQLAETIIHVFKIPQLCLVFCESPTLAHAAFDLFENVVLPLPIETVGSMLLKDNSSLVALFDLVTGKVNHASITRHVKQTVALVLGNLAKAGLLPNAVDRLGLRRHSIAALSAAVLIHGDEDSSIDEDEESLPRICVECLAAILSNQKEEMEMTALESRTMATAIGKTLSSTVLNRFFTQASLESTMDASIDHSLDRVAISRSAEAQLLCAMASSPESLIILGKVGGLEAISLIAHEGIITAIRAIQKACEINPKSIIDIDAHLSIMDAFIGVESKLSDNKSNGAELREIATICIQIMTKLVEGEDTKSAITHAEQSIECLEVAVYIISACSKLHGAKAPIPPNESEKALEKNTTTDSYDTAQQKEGTPSLVEDVCVKNIGQNENECTVNVEIDTDSETELETENDSAGTEKENEPGDSVEAIPPINTEREKTWCNFLTKNDFTLEKAAFSLLSAFGSVKHHRDWLIKNVFLIHAVIDLVQLEEPSLIGVQCNALDLLASFVLHLSESNNGSCQEDILAKLFCGVIESRTKSLQMTRDRQEQLGLKQLLALAVSGLQMLFCALSTDDKSRSLHATSDLFIYLADALFKGPKSRRSVAQALDGILFCNLSSFFVLSLGNDAARSSIFSRWFTSSVIRFVMMTAGIASLECHIPTSNSECGEYWDAAMTHCLFVLLCVINASSQGNLGISHATLIEGIPISGTRDSFKLCLRHIADRKFGGASSVSARQIIAMLDRLSC